MKLSHEHDKSRGVMRLTFGDTHFWNYELGFSGKTKVQEEEEEEEGDGEGPKGHTTIQLFSPERPKKPSERLQPEATWSLQDSGEAGMSYR